VSAIRKLQHVIEKSVFLVSQPHGIMAAVIDCVGSPRIVMTSGICKLKSRWCKSPLASFECGHLEHSRIRAPALPGRSPADIAARRGLRQTRLPSVLHRPGSGGEKIMGTHRCKITPTLSFSNGLFAYEVGEPHDFDWFHNEFVRLQQRYPTDCSRCWDALPNRAFLIRLEIGEMRNSVVKPFVSEIKGFIRFSSLRRLGG